MGAHNKVRIKLKPIFKTPTDKNYFFGYYDKSPVSLDGTKHLALEVDFIDRLPNKNDKARIGYFDLEKKDGIFYQITSTKTFNWQQGAMLQWYGNKNSQIIYNDIIDNKFVSIVYNLLTRNKRVLPMAIYSLSSNGNFALCIDNERHHWVRRGYSYDGISNQEKNKNFVESDGIYILDTDSGRVEQIINIKDLINFKTLESMKGGVHYLEHLMVSPDNKRLAFFHRWKLSDGGIFTRFYTANCDGSGLYLLNDSGRMSHFCWNQEGRLFGWGARQNAINSLRKYRNIVNFFIKPLLPLYKILISGNAIDGTSKISSALTGDSYILFNDETKDKELISSEFLDRDGHPTFCPVNEDWIVTDTYPNKNGLAQLILFNIKTSEKVVVSELRSIKKYDNTVNRCDLHPKWSYDGRFVSIDTMDNGIRGMYLYYVGDVIQ